MHVPLVQAPSAASVDQQRQRFAEKQRRRLEALWAGTFRAQFFSRLKEEALAGQMRTHHRLLLRELLEHLDHITTATPTSTSASPN